MIDCVSSLPEFELILSNKNKTDAPLSKEIIEKINKLYITELNLSDNNITSLEKNFTRVSVKLNLSNNKIKELPSSLVTVKV